MRSRLLLLPLTVSVLALASCASTPPASTPSPADASADGHGAISGAQEVDEPPLHLATIAADGTVSQLDLLSEQTSDIGAIDPPTALATDGRYLFADTADGVTIVDSGMWTWDHVDHFHYYRASPALLGTVPGEGAATVATTNSSTTGGAGVYFAETGDAVLLDVAALSRGEIVESFRLRTDPHAGMVVPVGSFALVTDADGTVSVHASDGDVVPGTRTACPDPRGTITTRVGAVVGCDDGALLASMQDGAVRIERIPLPEGAARPLSFANREGRPTAAGLSSDGRILLLDTRERQWVELPAPAPLVAVTAVDDADAHVVGLTADGRVVVIDGTSGTQLAITEPLVAASLARGDRPALIADDRRTYLTGPAEHLLFEIDVADGARIARTFTTSDEPLFVAETGR
ncbi:ABC transporter [Microbacterium sp. NPDC089189]|uniref:ABC transporter n=1 Tax=Microbacterium sp. NPDC089189 TaxID=3154972 RepID=UPI0034460640